MTIFLRRNNSRDIDISNRLDFAYQYLALIDQLSEKFEQLEELQKEMQDEKENEKVRRKKIRNVQLKSAKEWIKNLMEKSNYPYRFIENSSALYLCVKMNQRELYFTVNCKSIQKDVPLYLDVIKQFDDFMKTIPISGVSLTDNSANRKYLKWLNNK